VCCIRVFYVCAGAREGLKENAVLLCWSEMAAEKESVLQCIAVAVRCSAIVRERESGRERRCVAMCCNVLQLQCVAAPLCGSESAAEEEHNAIDASGPDTHPHTPPPMSVLILNPLPLLISAKSRGP